VYINVDLQAIESVWRDCPEITAIGIYGASGMILGLVEISFQEIIIGYDGYNDS